MYPQNVNSSGLPLPGHVEEKPQTILMAYNGSHIRQFGMLPVPCRKMNTQWVNAEFFIVKATGPAILGLPTCRDLQILILLWSMKENCARNKPVNTFDDLLVTYPDKFDNFGNFLYKYCIVVVDPSMPPVIHAAC